MARAVPQSRVRGRAAYRLIPSRFPPVGPWDRVARPEDFEALARARVVVLQDLEPDEACGQGEEHEHDEERHPLVALLELAELAAG